MQFSGCREEGSAAQIRFSDGGLLSLRPQSEFRIERYRFEDRPGGRAERDLLGARLGVQLTLNPKLGLSGSVAWQYSRYQGESVAVREKAPG